MARQEVNDGDSGLVSRTKLNQNDEELYDSSGLNTTHRGSDGKDHSDVVANNAKVSLDSNSVNVLQLAPKFKGSSVISAVDIDWDLEQIRTKTITENTIFTFSNLYIGVKTLQITGSFTISPFPTGFTMMDGSQAYDGTKVNWIDITCSDTGTPVGLVNIYF